ncbi:MAG: CDP-alcohol phosphatidyltransferase family protein [Planctomycetota bacterium]
MPPTLTIANVLTFARLILLPVVIVGIVTSQGWITVAAMALVLLTDLLDGRIARRLRQATQFGKALDSTVDFVLIYSLFIAFYAAGRLATYQFAILYIAMLTILSVQLLTQSGGTTPSSATGKLVGALEYIFLLFLTVREVLPEAPLLASLGLGLFLVLASAIALNTIVCLKMIVAATRPASDPSPSGGRGAG